MAKVRKIEPSPAHQRIAESIKKRFDQNYKIRSNKQLVSKQELAMKQWVKLAQ